MSPRRARSVSDLPASARAAADFSDLRLDGALWLRSGDDAMAGSARMRLLQAIADVGSITHAARSVDLSYKAAWTAIDEMNRLAGRPLVERSAGGRGGGSTRLTAHGEQVLARFHEVEAAHRRFLAGVEAAAVDPAVPFSPLHGVAVRASACNQWSGQVVAVRAGAVKDEVVLQMPGGARLTAIITSGSTADLGLRLQQPVIALVQAAGVMLACGLPQGGVRVSARNQLPGVVRSIRAGAVQDEVRVEGEGGLAITALLPSGAVAAMGLAPGAAVTALVQAGDMILVTAG